MRARKAERCLQRASAALDDGSIAEASDALDEARRLSSANPLLEELTARLDALKLPAPHVATRGDGYWWTGVTIAAGFIVFTAVGWEGWVHRERLALLLPKAHTEMDASTGMANPTPIGVPTRGATESAASPSSQPASSSSDAIVQTTLIRPDQVIDTRASASDSPGAGSSSVATTGNTKRIETQLDTTRTVAANRPAAELPPRPQREAATAPAIDVRTPPALPAAQPAAVSNLIPPIAPSPETSRAANLASNSSTSPTSDAMPAVNVPSGSSAPSASMPAATAAPLRDERAAIRTALNRYEAAYNRLDVEAVHTIWPTLDQRALARAFDSLTAQRVSLQNCSVDVSGSTARANCSGSAAWTPKIGGGERSAARKWAFDLNESDGGWRIVHVQAR